MNTSNTAFKIEAPELHKVQSITGDTPDVFADIYQENINIAIWQRAPKAALTSAAQYLLQEQPNLQIALSTAPNDVLEVMQDHLGFSEHGLLVSQDIQILSDMFCCLFELERIGIRLISLQHAMCPRFHVDKIQCRMITTYQGEATQWLNNSDIDRQRLGTGNNGKSDRKSGLIQSDAQIHQLNQGDVALLKGESWENNEGFGLVHRSPQMDQDQSRLLLTFDFA